MRQWEREGIKLICGFNANFEIDATAVITDPPYGMRYKSGPNSSNSISSTGKRFSKRIIGDDTPFEPEKWTEKYEICAFTGARHFYHKLPAKGTLHCWDKRGNYKPLDQADADIIWVSNKKVSRVFHCAWRGICRHTENRCKILHPTQKPIALMEWIIGLCDLPTHSCIYDPYMGVATTAIAAKNLGHDFIGIEADMHYFKEAVKRVEDYLDQ